MVQKDDIYKKDSVPRFARGKYKKRNMGSVDRHPDVASNSRRSMPAGGAASRFEGRMQGGGSRSRSRSGSGGRSSRNPQGNRANIVIVGILIFALAAYAAVLGFVKMRGVRGGGKPAPTATNKPSPKPPVASPSLVKMGTEVEANQAGETASVVAPVEQGPSLALNKPINEFIADLRKARNEIKAVDTPLNTASPEETIARLEKQLATTPYLLDLKTELARRYLANEQYLEAATQLTEILGAEPYNMRCRLMLAETFSESADHESAIRVAQWILEEDKFSTDARNILADSYMKIGNYPKAIAHLRALANENSLDVVTQNNLGVAHTRMKRFDLAIPIFEKTIRIDKANAVGYFNLAICHAQQNASQKACDVIYKAADQFGPSFVAQWINSPKFDPIARTAPFERLRARFKGYVSDPDGAALLQNEEKPTAPFGKAALPPEVNLND